MHKHHWSVVTRRFTAPISGLKSAKGMTEEILMDVLYGFTTVEEQCSICGKTTFQNVNGDQR